ncbi:transglycosylase family protein [Skermania piniformis]|uniref:transglycosylase family protein n=1 Tax=Skermania pinensis TaxID=39122 RepID=UPI0009F94DBD|nr:transglycosylase family protein [Skermania piniformis]
MRSNRRFTHLLGAAALFGGLVAGAVGITASNATAEGHNWDGVAACESGGDWSINTGNGFSGGLQFTESTWQEYGGSGMAHNASKAEQIRVAENVLAGQGPGAWPVCGQYLTGGQSAGVTETAPRATTPSQPDYRQVSQPAPQPTPAEPTVPTTEPEISPTTEPWTTDQRTTEQWTADLSPAVTQPDYRELAARTVDRVVEQSNYLAGQAERLAAQHDALHAQVQQFVGNAGVAIGSVPR